ncbi:hypothetical protein HPP92_001352 [Vanilla planifolia]|uniref:Glycosylphosphatidylinositol anchor biosynthesis protein 11 n=1 Tax=Vanilla planifolia TaxID=51239 RepID=A0A835VLA8_VANPL|nr:hypothetical protein HPP92_001352 [Vanilla planifolia]
MPVFPRSATGLPTYPVHLVATGPLHHPTLPQLLPHPSIAAPPQPSPLPSPFLQPQPHLAAGLPASQVTPPPISPSHRITSLWPPSPIRIQSSISPPPIRFYFLVTTCPSTPPPSSAGPAAAIFPIFPLVRDPTCYRFGMLFTLILISLCQLSRSWDIIEKYESMFSKYFLRFFRLLVVTNLKTMSAIEIDRRMAAVLQSFCGLSFMIASYVMTNLYSLNLITHTTETLRLILIIQGPIVVFVYSFLRRDHQQSSYWWAVVRGLSALPVGALVNAFGAIVLGAPVGIRYLPNTIYWSLLMSLFTFVPPVCVFGSSRADWHHILAHFRQDEPLNALVSLPAYGSVVGAWLGAWPMPLDWERPWQEWPVCVSYGAAAGYLVGLLTSSVLVLVQGRARVKKD